MGLSFDKQKSNQYKYCTSFEQRTVQYYRLYNTRQTFQFDWGEHSTPAGSSSSTERCTWTSCTSSAISLAVAGHCSPIRNTPYSYKIFIYIYIYILYEESDVYVSLPSQARNFWMAGNMHGVTGAGRAGVRYGWAQRAELWAHWERGSNQQCNSRAAQAHRLYSTLLHMRSLPRHTPKEYCTARKQAARPTRHEWLVNSYAILLDHIQFLIR